MGVLGVREHVELSTVCHEQTRKSIYANTFDLLFSRLALVKPSFDQNKPNKVYQIVKPFCIDSNIQIVLVVEKNLMTLSFIFSLCFALDNCDRVYVARGMANTIKLLQLF
jgi:hypothetical protein